MEIPTQSNPTNKPSSNILLQRQTKTWPPLFKTLNLSTSKYSKTILTPNFYLQIFNKIQSNPQISLNFFNFAKKNLGVSPDLKTQCNISHILFNSTLSSQGKLILYSLIEPYPPTKIVSSVIQTCHNDCSCVLSNVIECYCSKKMFLQDLVVYRNDRNCGVLVSICSCNVFLNLLCEMNEVGLALCLYGLMKRDGVLENLVTLSTIAEVLKKCGKCERVERILDMGICSPVIYDIVIELYSKKVTLRMGLLFG